MKKINIIGDIGGQYDALMQLMKEVPKADLTVLVGDLNDRGPKSKEVIEWAMTTPEVITLHSNHGCMFVHWYRTIKKERRILGPNYTLLDFFNNGGLATLKSYGTGTTQEDFLNVIPEEHIRWLDSLPLKFEAPGLLVTHAAYNKYSDRFNDRFNAVWNRDYPNEIEGVFQVMGHNAHWGLTVTNWFACIDDSRKKLLTCLHWPDKTIHQVKF